ncbi:Uncharacterised protein [Segatella copri]|nr:Uncharacterised protein [Segatella copri]
MEKQFLNGNLLRNRAVWVTSIFNTFSLSLQTGYLDV